MQLVPAEQGASTQTHMVQELCASLSRATDLLLRACEPDNVQLNISAQKVDSSSLDLGGVPKWATHMPDKRHVL